MDAAAAQGPVNPPLAQLEAVFSQNHKAAAKK
jgi:hypothetical protein